MDTLVLSAAYEPIGRVPWRDAMSMWVSGRVEIIEEHLDRFIGTVKGALAMPAIVRFVGSHVRKRYRMRVKFSKSNVYLRDHGRCQYCNVWGSRDVATYDHVIPKSQGGQTNWKNIVIACFPCNQLKAARTPERAKMRLLSLPSRPKYLPGVSNEIPFRPGMPESWRPFLAAI